VPGPVLRVKQGDEVWLRLNNNLPQSTTIHWHGIRIDNAMDGVAGLTQQPVPPGETFDYKFKVPDAGTFWYHPHNRSWEQMARGLYGALIVEEPQAPDVDQDLVVIADDWRLNEDGAIDEESFGSIRDRAHAGRVGNILSINGKPRGEFPVRSGQRVRFRLINTCNARILKLRFEDLNPQVIALDGQPVAPYALEHGMVRIAPAQRVDLLIDMTGDPGVTQAITEVSQSRLVAATFNYSRQPPLPVRTSQVKLADNGLRHPAVASARKIDLIMTGGAMGQADKITYQGKSYDIRQLISEHGMVWAFNGTAGMPEAPLFSARLGESIAVRMVNDTRWPHAMHFHGHHFKEAHSGAPWRDTLLMDAGETRTVYLSADNPGKWMLHCHMLEHQAGGMATWFEVNA
jgi:FtsP/CotA-like multicopper oxidase with cupredoxin domain